MTDSHELNGEAAANDDEKALADAVNLRTISEEDILYVDDNAIEVEDSTEVVFAI